MGESGVILLMVPIGYVIVFLTLLLAAIVVAFVPKWRFLSAYFVGAALAAVPAFLLWWFPCLYCCGELAMIAEKKNLSFAGYSLVLPLIFTAFAAAILCFALGAFVSSKIVYKWRHDAIGL